MTDRNCAVTVFPYDVKISEIEEFSPDGFLSNGPGDPEPCSELINLQNFINKTYFWNCLGHQILALALGAKTEKMKFGHHGSNHPVQDLLTKKVFITSQNHCYTVNESNLKKILKLLISHFLMAPFRELNIFPEFFSFQGLSEASPGPQESEYIFDKFINIMKKNKFTNA